MTKEIKFCFAHFPVGTIFEIGEPLTKLSSFKEVTQFEVTGIVRNGANSYILETTHFNEYEAPVFDENHKLTGEMRIERMNTALHIDHVKRIIKRGDGPVKLRPSGYNSDHRVYSEKIKKGRGSYAGYFGLETLVAHLANKLTPATGCVDSEGLYQYLLKHAPFSMQYVTGDDSYYGMPVVRTKLQIRKKKLKKAIRQNINRFLKSPAKTQKAWDDAIAEDCENDWNDSYDREHNLGKYSRGEADLDSGHDDTFYGSALDERLPLLAGNNSGEVVDEQDFLTDRVEIVQEETHV